MKKGKKEVTDDPESGHGGGDEVITLSGEMKRLEITTTVTVEIGGSRDRAQHDGSRAEASGSGSAADDPESENEPWRLPRFEKAPRGADKWDLSLMSSGWLIRHHGTKGRVRPFHPIHKSCPVRGDDLTGERVTKLFNAAIPRGEVLHDRWMEQRTWQRAGPWSGYTFLRLKEGNAKKDGTISSGYGKPPGLPTPSVSAADGSSADDGYSFVTEG